VQEHAAQEATVRLQSLSPPVERVAVLGDELSPLDQTQGGAHISRGALERGVEQQPGQCSVLIGRIRAESAPRLFWRARTDLFETAHLGLSRIRREGKNMNSYARSLAPVR
jgi:hypothetical protein